MSIAFSGRTNFSRFNATAALQIREVKHEAFIDVDEAGSTAAAATSVGITLSVSLGPQPLLINHPFIFAIREISSGLIVFAGAVNNPLSAVE